MKSTRLALVLLLAGTTTVFAQDTFDADGDGMVSLVEIQAVYTDFTEEQFAELDTDGDGMLNADEMTAAMDSEAFPAGE